MRRGVKFAATVLMISAALIANPMSTMAAEPTGAGTQATVNYGTVSQADKDVLRGFFDADYYKANNPKVVAEVGDDAEALFNHFCTYGIFEGRTCQQNMVQILWLILFTILLKDAMRTDLRPQLMSAQKEELE